MTEPSMVGDVAEVPKISEEEMVKRLMSSGKYRITNMLLPEPESSVPSFKGKGRGKVLRDSILASQGNTSTPVNKNLKVQLFDVPNHSHIQNEHEMAYQVINPIIPKLPLFSGEEPCPKSEVTYYEWNFEVKCSLTDDSISPNSMLQAFRRSLRGSARQVLMSLGTHASLEVVLKKMESMFANTSARNNVMQEFFNAYQQPQESVTAFACRLESILYSAVDKFQMSDDTRNDMLRSKFWTSLHSEQLRSQTRHKYDSVESYEDLIKEIRRVEHELTVANNPSPMSNPVKLGTADNSRHPPYANTQRPSSSKMYQNVVTANTSSSSESLLESKFNRRFEEFDKKLELIMNKIDQMPTYIHPPPNMPNNAPYNHPTPNVPNNAMYNNPPPNVHNNFRGRGRGYQGHNQARGGYRGRMQNQPKE